VDKDWSRAARRRASHPGREVLIDGQRVDKAGSLIPTDADIELKGRSPYVSRGGEKLVHALEHFALVVKGRVCIDVGSSTGGFTDCLLQRGAAACSRLTSGPTSSTRSSARIRGWS